MDMLKKALGVLWLLAGAALAVYLPYKAVSELTAAAASSEDFVFWIVITGIFIPISVGFILFGFYALKGEYDAAE
ncbi:MAG TPA: hypothetical protein VGE26_11465 [Sphingobacteriaceae bacterium]